MSKIGAGVLEKPSLLLTLFIDVNEVSSTILYLERKKRKTIY
jgi:hypothetical protein